MIHVGFAETDITPKLGSECPGGMQKRRLNEVHDPLKAVAMVVESNETAIALVGIDSVFVSEEATARPARQSHWRPRFLAQISSSARVIRMAAVQSPLASGPRLIPNT